MLGSMPGNYIDFGMNDTWVSIRCEIKFIHTINGKRIPQGKGIRFGLSEARVKQDRWLWHNDLVGAWSGVVWRHLSAGWDSYGLNFPISTKEGSIWAFVGLQTSQEPLSCNLKPFPLPTLRTRKDRRKRPLHIGRCTVNKQRNLQGSSWVTIRLVAFNTHLPNLKSLHRGHN